MLLATPLPAAAGDIWDIIAYIHELSGPGPFHHAGGPLGIYGFEVFCRDDDGSPSPVCTTERRDVRFYALLELGWLNDKPRDDNPIRFDGNVFLRTYQLVAYVPGQKIAGLRSIPGLANGLDLGAGFGLYHFTGAAVTEESLWRISIPLRARFTPSEFWANSDYLQRTDRRRLRALLRSVTYQVGFDILPQSFSNRDFRGPETYAPSGHALWTNALVVDAFVVIDAFRR
jgi:hypothetical protein